MAESETKEKAMGKDNPSEEKKEKTTPKKAKKSEIIASKGGSSEKINSTMKGPVKYVQNGVTSGKGKKGVYIWYKDPRNGGATADDRDFVEDKNMADARQMNEMRTYEANKNKK